MNNQKALWIGTAVVVVLMLVGAVLVARQRSVPFEPVTAQQPVPQEQAAATPVQKLAGSTVMSTVSALEVAPALSVTIRENVRVSPARVSGAVNVGLAAELEESVTVVPAVWVQA